MKQNMERLLKKRAGIRLDLGCGENKQPGFVGMDNRRLKGVEIIHDLERFPWPLPDESCVVVMGSHIIEHIKPWLTIKLMNEVWRISRPGADLLFSHPYGVNELFVQDPTHCNPCNHITWQYYDPRYPLWGIYKPKPWRIQPGFPVWQVTGCMEVHFRKVTEKEGKRMFVEENLGAPRK